MSDEIVERNKANWRRFQEDMIPNKKLELLDELMAPEMIVHRFGEPETWSREKFRAAYWEMTGQLDAWRTVDAINGEGDIIWARWTINFVHSVPVHGIEPTGRQLKTEEWGQIRFDDEGRVAEGWFMTSPNFIYQQLGIKVTLGPPVEQPA